MQSLWSDREARQFQGDLGLRVYTSRLLGRDKSLVLHGGGNTSVKTVVTDLVGEKTTRVDGKPLEPGKPVEFICSPSYSPELSKASRAESKSESRGFVAAATASSRCRASRVPRRTVATCGSRRTN